MRTALALLIGGGAVLLAGCRAPTAVSPTSPGEELVQLNQEIEALQFVNSLQLQPHQIGPLRQTLQEMAAAEATKEQERNKLRAQLILLLRQKRDALRAQQSTADIDAQIREVQGKLTSLAGDDPATVKRIADKLRGILTREQVALATGELDARIQATQMLDAYRQFPVDEFDAQVKPFAEELVSRGSSMTADQVVALFTDARSLADDEYQQNKEKLVSQLMPLFAPTGEAADQLLVEAFSRPRMLEALPASAAAPKGQAPQKGGK
jgi:hypothetical protein